MALDSNTLRNRANGLMSGFSAGQRMVVGIAIITLVAGGAFFAQWAAKPTMVPLFSNLTPDDASAITEKLQSGNTKYDLTDGGRTVMVPQSKVYQLRIDLASDGIPSGGSEGYKLLDKQGITTSEFREHVDYQRALQGELSKTIGAIDGVQAATVNLVIPKQDVFADDSRKPSASVLVKTAPGKGLGGQSVQSIVNLVASSVEGLDPTNVTVADDKGRLLASPGGGVNGGSEDQQRAATQSLEDGLTNRIQNMLMPVVGQGKAVVQARAELNWDKESTTAEVWNPNNKPAEAASQRTKTETYSGNGTAAAGCIGNGTPVDNAVCQDPQGAGGSGAYSTTENEQDNRTDRTVVQTQKAPGSVDRISVAVLLDSNVAGVDATEIEKLVRDAAGLQVARGDTVTVSRMAFDESAAKAAADELKASEKAQKSEDTLSIIKMVVTFLIILIVLVVLFITTKRKANSYTSTPISLAELDNVMPALPSADDMLGALDSPQSALDANSPEAIERAKVDREITDLIEKQPDEVASLLRNWLADRRG